MINLAATFCINCRGLMELAGRPAKRALQWSSLDRTRAWTRSCVACSEWKGLIFLILYNANLHDRAVLVMWSVKFSLSSITTPRFLSVFEGFMVDETNWKVKLWWNGGFAETTSVSVLARLSWRWWSFIFFLFYETQMEMFWGMFTLLFSIQWNLFIAHKAIVWLQNTALE